MTELRFTGQTDLATGTTVTTTNYGTPDQPNIVAPGTGGTIVVQAAAASSGPGAKVARITPAAGVKSYYGSNNLPGAGTHLGVQAILTLPAIPASDQTIFHGGDGNRNPLPSAGTGIGLWNVLLTSGGFLKVVSDASATTATATVALTANTSYELRVEVENVSTTTGRLAVTVWNATTGAQISNAGASISGVSLGTAALASVFVGKVITTGNLGALDVKHFYVRTGTTTAAFFTTRAGTPAYTLSPASKVQVGSTATSLTVATDPGVTHSWVLTSKPSGSTATTADISGATTATATLSARSTPGVYVLTDTIDAGSGATVAAVGQIHVQAANGAAALAWDVNASTGHTAAGTAATVLDALRDTTGAGWALAPVGGGTVDVDVETAYSGAGTSTTVSIRGGWRDGAAWVASAGTHNLQLFLGSSPLTGQVTFNLGDTSGMTVGTYTLTASEQSAYNANPAALRAVVTTAG